MLTCFTDSTSLSQTSEINGGAALPAFVCWLNAEWHESVPLWRKHVLNTCNKCIHMLCVNLKSILILQSAK